MCRLVGGLSGVDDVGVGTDCGTVGVSHTATLFSGSSMDGP